MTTKQRFPRIRVGDRVAVLGSTNVEQAYTGTVLEVFHRSWWNRYQDGEHTGSYKIKPDQELRWSDHQSKPYAFLIEPPSVVQPIPAK